MLFCEDHSRAVFIYFVKAKSDFAKVLDKFIKMVDNQFGLTIKILRTDRGGEFVNSEVAEILADWGIHHECTPAHSSALNGVAE